MYFIVYSNKCLQTYKITSYLCTKSHLHFSANVRHHQADDNTKEFCDLINLIGWKVSWIRVFQFRIRNSCSISKLINSYKMACCLRKWYSSRGTKRNLCVKKKEKRKMLLTSCVLHFGFQWKTSDSSHARFLNACIMRSQNVFPLTFIIPTDYLFSGTWWSLKRHLWNEWLRQSFGYWNFVLIIN